MASGFKRRLSSDREIQIVGITSVDLNAQTASGLTRERFDLLINTSYSVGELNVTPAIGEQWYVERIQGAWRLLSRIPFNDPTATIEVTEGQVKVGSGRGPVELTGTAINAHSALQLFACATDERPTGIRVGAMVYDSDLMKPIFYDGSGWRDAAGASV